MVCGVPNRRLLVASKSRLLQDERTKSSLSTGELVDEDDRTVAGVRFGSVPVSIPVVLLEVGTPPSRLATVNGTAIFSTQPVRR